MNISENTLIYDLETKTFGNPNPERDKLKIFACHSYKTKKIYLLKDRESIQKILYNHKYLVGFNNKYYDNIILLKDGYDIKYKTIIDLREVIDKRCGIIKTDKGLLSDLLIEKSLKFITQVLNIVDEDTGKKELDYSLLNKDNITQEEQQLINDYTKRDIEVTKKLYEWCEEHFEAFKYFVIEKDILNKSYLTAASATFAYKALCKEMNWEVLYNDDDVHNEKITGGYVSYPAGERFEGNIYCVDFQSMYPHCMMQCNLYGRKKVGDLSEQEPPVWNGNNIWKTNGIYYSDNLSPVGQVIQKWFKQRLEYKKVKDKKEYALKILLNILYGIMDNPKYNKTFDSIAASDCTGISRQWIKYARKVFRDKGYLVIYTDTDSIYIQDPFNNKEQLVNVTKEIVDYIKSTVPFPQDTFKMELEAEIKYIFFFKGEVKEEDNEMDSDDYTNRLKGLLKKNYIYVTKDNKVVVKNLGVKKKSTSLLSREIFWKYMVPEIIKTGQCKFSRQWITNLIQELLEKNIKLATIRYSVGDFSEYKDSPGSIYAQISNKYGSGIFFLIPNLKNIGIGKGKSYCTLEEFKKHNLKIQDINLENVYSELEYFTKPVITKNIFDY
jgi:hypothetical protein